LRRGEAGFALRSAPMPLAHVDGGASSPPALTLSTFFSESRLELWPALVIVGMGALYVIGVLRLRTRDRQWSTARSISFMSGLAALAIASQSGLAAYDTVLFSAHVGQHLLIGVAAPFLLALGAPITLALQATARATQVRLLTVLHSQPVRILTHPIVAWILFGLTLFALYFTPVYELSLRDSFVHELVHLHFLVVGAVFFWAVIGLDPVAWRIPYGFRLLLVLLTVPFHAFLGLALMAGDQPVAADYYAETPRPADVDVLADQRTGAGVMWVLGDVIGLVAGTVVLTQWMRHEDRATRRADEAAERASLAGA
jgi:putative copper resistance protein D